MIAGQNFVIKLYYTTYRVYVANSLSPSHPFIDEDCGPGDEINQDLNNYHEI